MTLFEDFTAYVEAKDGEFSAENRAEFMEKYQDKSKSYEFDEDLMQRIVKFYDDHCKAL